MDYQDVPEDVLDLAVRASKAANAEYWACDIALGKDGKLRILECATAFAAFPYIRDWIGQYLMWLLSDGKFRKPHIPMFNWEELGKIDSGLLRTMRHITFAKYTPSQDSNELFNQLDEMGFPIVDTQYCPEEEWPSEIWNRQDNFKLPAKVIEAKKIQTMPGADEQSQNVFGSYEPAGFDDEQLRQFLTDIKGIGEKMVKDIIDHFSAQGFVEAINTDPQTLCVVKNLKQKKLALILESWSQKYLTA
ncbi:helix-hairpin-helix domain-containing protein [Veronia nyctiphanis]|uniref:helix-hairpin-helix domain-containing protein n=1 Tax=Veronia nyctiphanis TaxID=1278244 RepID=UPI001F4249B3|nr:helix-hairpin-helix domain-containing protein [Veronia nyctiphanis]